MDYRIVYKGKEIYNTFEGLKNNQEYFDFNGFDDLFINGKDIVAITSQKKKKIYLGNIENRDFRIDCFIKEDKNGNKIFENDIIEIKVINEMAGTEETYELKAKKELY